MRTLLTFLTLFVATSLHAEYFRPSRTIPNEHRSRYVEPQYRPQYRVQYYAPTYVRSHQRYRPAPPRPPRQYAPQYRNGQWQTSPWGRSRPTVYTVPDDLRDARSPEHVHRLAYGTPEE